jgi:hypothetical protein
MGSQDCSRCGETQHGRKERCIGICTKTSRPCKRRYISGSVPFCLQHMIGTIRASSAPQPVWDSMSAPIQQNIIVWAIWYIRKRKQSDANDAYVRLLSAALVTNPLYDRITSVVGPDVTRKVADFVPRNFSNTRPAEYPFVVRLHLDTRFIKHNQFILATQEDRDLFNGDTVDLSRFRNVRHITMSDEFDKRVSVFPDRLQSLQIGTDYSYHLDKLPPGLKHLDLW